MKTPGPPTSVPLNTPVEKSSLVMWMVWGYFADPTVETLSQFPLRSMNWSAQATGMLIARARPMPRSARQNAAPIRFRNPSDGARVYMLKPCPSPQTDQRPILSGDGRVGEQPGGILTTLCIAYQSYCQPPETTSCQLFADRPARPAGGLSGAGLRPGR